MKIKTRLALQFTLVVTGILLIFSLLVYFFWFRTQQSRYRDNLLNTAKTTGTLFFNIPAADSAELSKLHSNTLLWRNEEIVITDSAFNIIYSNRASYLSGNMLKLNGGPSEVQYFSINEKDGVRYSKRENNRFYNVYVLAYDRARAYNMKHLTIILIWDIIIGLILSAGLSYVFASHSLLPLSRLSKKVKNIDFGKLAQLAEANQKDEIGQLAESINDMIDRLDRSARNHEEFITNASHELRTALSVLISEADYILGHGSDKEEYQEHIRIMLNDLKKLNSVTNGLLELSRLNRYSEVSVFPIKVDEVIYNVIPVLKKKYKDIKIMTKVNFSNNESDLIINGNKVLLEIALRNIIDNACKFSNDDVLVEISPEKESVHVEVTDKGVGIPKSEVEYIFDRFSRASNIRQKKGFGVGLSIVSRIIELHNAQIRIESENNKGTKVILIFKKVNH